MDIARIRKALVDLESPEAAPRLNAQVRLREEHVEMLQLLLEELDKAERDRDRANDGLCLELQTTDGGWVDEPG